jgi:hypothetical protein
MEALQFWKAVALDEANMLESLVGLLEEQRVAYCVVGGQAVNAYVDPLVSMDLDIVIAVDDLERIRSLLEARFTVEIFPHSINLALEGSGLRAQIQTDPRYASFLARSERRGVLGLVLPVAGIEDLLQGKIWAVTDETRRASKRQKDLADIARILEAYPNLRSRVPEEILGRLMS